MCVVSTVIDHYRKEWPYVPHDPVPSPTVFPTINYPHPPQQQIDELIDLLKKAVEIDKKTNQPNCEKPELIKWMQDILNNFDKLHRKLDDILSGKKLKKHRKLRKKS